MFKIHFNEVYEKNCVHKKHVWCTHTKKTGQSDFALNPKSKRWKLFENKWKSGLVSMWLILKGKVTYVWWPASEGYCHMFRSVGGGSRFASHHAHQSCLWCSFKLADMIRTVMLCVNASDCRQFARSFPTLVSQNCPWSCPWCSFKLADMIRTIVLCVNASDRKQFAHSFPTLVSQPQGQHSIQLSRERVWNVMSQ